MIPVRETCSSSGILLQFAGKYCPEAGTIPDTLLVCSAGFECKEGCATSTPPEGNACGGPCPKGKFCTAGNAFLVDIHAFL